MLTISVKDFDETAIAIMKISENLWHYLYRLLDQLDKPKMDLFLIRLHDLLTEKASPIIWIVEESDTEFTYIITCEIMELLDGYFNIEEGRWRRKGIRKHWWIKKINENE